MLILIFKPFKVGDYIVVGNLEGTVRTFNESIRELIYNRMNEIINGIAQSVGGKAELILENEDDVLNCGIDIRVQPPGKKLQNMTLLSGGEKAFTAIAILFAIFLLSPVNITIFDIP